MKRLCVLALLPLLLLSSCGKAPESVSRTEFHLLDTVITLTLFEPLDEDLLDRAFSKIAEDEKLFSKTVEGSDIDRLNRAGGEPVTVSEDTVLLLEKAISYGAFSDGRFDVTIAPLSALWDFSSDDPTIPQKETIESLLPLVDYRCISISGNTVTLPKDFSLDLGGIAKGYIADRLKAFLVQNGVKSAVLNLGGNVLTIGEKPDGTPFQIGIRKPFKNQNDLLTTVSVRDSSVVTSGVYERCFEKDGKLYHHILDPDTGFPMESGLLSVTVLSENSVDGDALSTLLFAMGPDEALQKAEALPGVEALLIKTDGSVLKTTGFLAE